MPGGGGEEWREHGGVESARAGPGVDCQDAARTPRGLGRASTAQQTGVFSSLPRGRCGGQCVGEPEDFR